MQNLNDASRENAKWNRVWNEGFKAGSKRTEDELLYYMESKEEFNQTLEALMREHWHIHLAKKESTKELVMEQQVLWKTKNELVDAKEALKAESEVYAKRRSRIRAGMWEDYETERKKLKVDYETVREERKKLKAEREEIKKELQWVLHKKAQVDQASHDALEQWNQIKSGEQFAYDAGKADGKAEALADFKNLPIKRPLRSMDEIVAMCGDKGEQEEMNPHHSADNAELSEADADERAEAAELRHHLRQLGSFPCVLG